MKKENSGWLWGTHAVLAALNNPSRQVQQILITKQTFDENLELLSEFKDKVKFLETRELTQRFGDGVVHQGIAAKMSPLNTSYDPGFFRKLPDDAKVVVLDHVTDPHNVGAIIRTCTALGAAALVMTEKHSPELDGVLAKTACGGIEILPIFKVTNLARVMEDLKKFGFWCVALDERGDKTIVEEGLSGKLALFMGAEGEGIRRLTRENCDFLVRLPTSPDFPTLNVSVATAIALYELVR